MKIVVNTRLLIKGKLSGIGWFTYHIIKRLAEINPDVTFILIFDRKHNNHFNFGPNVIFEIVHPPTRHPILQYYWLEFAIPRIIKKYTPDLFFSPDGFSSLRLKNVLKLITIHDINFHHHPTDLPFFDSFFWRYFIPRYAHNANRIITVSQFSKNDICTSYNINSKLVDVVYNGANSLYTPISDSEKIQTKKMLTHGSDYFLYVGVFVARKNLTRLIVAFNKFKNLTHSNVKLVLVGSRMSLTGSMDLAYKASEFKKDILFTGPLEPEILKNIMGSALALTFVSYFEGFGIPLIEAMNAGVPVIASSTSSLPEIAADAAIYVNPYNTSSICNAMVKIFTDENLRKVLIDKGHQQKLRFNWDTSAKQIWNIMQTMIMSAKN